MGTGGNKPCGSDVQKQREPKTGKDWGGEAMRIPAMTRLRFPHKSSVPRDCETSLGWLQSAVRQLDHEADNGGGERHRGVPMELRASPEATKKVEDQSKSTPAILAQASPVAPLAQTTLPWQGATESGCHRLSPTCILFAQ